MGARSLVMYVFAYLALVSTACVWRVNWAFATEPLTSPRSPACHVDLHLYPHPHPQADAAKSFDYVRQLVIFTLKPQLEEMVTQMIVSAVRFDWRRACWPALPAAHRLGRAVVLRATAALVWTGSDVPDTSRVAPANEQPCVGVC